MLNKKNVVINLNDRVQKLGLIDAGDGTVYLWVFM